MPTFLPASPFAEQFSPEHARPTEFVDRLRNARLTRGDATPVDDLRLKAETLKKMGWLRPLAGTSCTAVLSYISVSSCHQCWISCSD